MNENNTNNTTNETDGKKTIKVSAKSPVQPLASSIVISVNSGEHVILRACGASSVNQMLKACAVARGTLAAQGKDLFIKPGFDEVVEDGKKKTIMLAIIKID